MKRPVATATPNGPAAERPEMVTQAARPTMALLNTPDPTVLPQEARQ